MTHIVIFYLGAIFGSYLSLVIARTMRGESTIVPRSHCEMCGKELGVFEIIPIFSYIFQKGRCKNCGARIGGESLLIEIICGLLALLFLREGIFLQNILLLSSIFLGLVIGIIDWKTMDIYQNHLVILLGLGLIYRYLYIGFTKEVLIHILVFSLLYFLIYKISGKNIGDGDYYFYICLALFVRDSDFILFVLGSIWIGAIAGVVILIKSRMRDRHMPFAISVFISYLLMMTKNMGVCL